MSIVIFYPNFFSHLGIGILGMVSQVRFLGLDCLADRVRACGAGPAGCFWSWGFLYRLSIEE